ncbi:TonB-dependent receptor [Croceivirga radicis]|uniref:TonB-dependent receptor n=1 Tax=Croceivirga radicis TaxID=1929488 RepID=A0A1V6LP35_9FLAO|nr:TonB-dependent receptor [Croceivirga radicis]OQD41954.1 TonB-dependent receptor [Croceivirga radicis]
MSIRQLIFGLGMAITSILSAQNKPSIQGTVIDAHTLEPLFGVNLIAKDGFATTDQNGTFLLKTKYDSFVASHIGYADKEYTITSDTKTPIILKLKPISTELDGVTLKGKSQQRLAQESATVSIAVDEEYLHANRENSLMQTLKKIPGVSTMTIGSGQSKPTIRGLGFNRVSVVQNGIKHEAQQWGSDHGLEIDQYGIDEIRIIKGPASLLFGSDAIAGVVDIQPPKLPMPNSFSGEVTILGETNNDLLAFSTGIQGRKDQWYYRGRITYRDYADFKVPTEQINYENYIFELQDNNLRNTAGEEANSSFSFGYVGETFRTETFVSNVNAKNGFFANAHGLEVRNSSIDYDTSNRDVDLPFHKVNHIKITNNTTLQLDNHTLKIDFGYQNNQREEQSEPVPHGFMPTPPDSKERIFTKNTYTLNAKDVIVINNKHTFSAGLNTELQNNNIGGWGFLIPAYDRYSIGGYLFDHFEATPNLHLQAGIRYDYGLITTKTHTDWFQTPRQNADGSTSTIFLQRATNSRLNFSSFSGGIGASYLKEHTTYKLNIGNSFRMPLAHELSSDGVNYHMYRYERGNLSLDPESSYQIDAEVSYAKQKFSFGLSPFANYFDNYIYLNPTPNYYETLQIYEYTQAEVFRIGGEASIGYQWFKNFNVSASAEYVYAEQTSGPKEGFTIPFSPPLIGMFSFTYGKEQLGIFTDINFTTDVRIAAAQKEIVPPEEITDGYQVIHMSLMGKAPLFSKSKPIQIRLKLNNLFNTEYYDHTSFYRLIDVPEAGRNIAVSLTQQF